MAQTALYSSQLVTVVIGAHILLQGWLVQQPALLEPVATGLR
jgi:hypothetical protein